MVLFTVILYQWEPNRAQILAELLQLTLFQLSGFPSRLIFSSSLHSDKMLSNLLPTAQISDLDISADTSKIDRCWKKASRPPIESTRYKEEPPSLTYKRKKKITINVRPQPKTVYFWLWTNTFCLHQITITNIEKCDLNLSCLLPSGFTIGPSKVHNAILAHP